ncbi:hypothetical protein OG977_38555 [Kitasatospora purpeofusca]
MGVGPGQFRQDGLRQVVEEAAAGLAVADREEQGDAVGLEAARDDREDGQGLLVEPLRVVAHAQQRPVGGAVREQGQGREPDQQAVRTVARDQSERRAQRVPLRRGEPVEVVQEGQEEAVQTGEAEILLGLLAADPGDPHVGGPFHRVRQQ